MKSHLFVLTLLFCAYFSFGQRQRSQPKYYVARVGLNVTHLANYKTNEENFYGGGNFLIELPFAKKWAVGFGFGQAVFNDNQKPYFNSVAVWKETLKSMFTDFKFYPQGRYNGFYVGATEGLMLRKIDALIPLENDVLNRQTRIPYNERFNSFAMGFNTGYSLAFKRNWLLTAELKTLALRNEWVYQVGISCGYKFQ